MPGNSPPSLLNLIIVEAAAEPYMDVAGICRLKRKCDGVDEHQSPYLPWPIQSRTIEAWMAKVYFDKTNGFVSRTELADTILVLEGMAQEKQQKNPDLADVIEQDPVLATLLTFLATDNSSSDKKQRTWSGTATDLLAKLLSIAFSQGISPERHQAWPSDAARLSSRLRELTPWLAKAGIAYSYTRSGKQRTHSFAPKPPAPPTPQMAPSYSSSLSASHAHSGNCEVFPPSDASVGGDAGSQSLRLIDTQWSNL